MTRHGLNPRPSGRGARQEKLALPGAPGQMLVTYHAEPGSPSHERLQLLGNLTAYPAPDPSIRRDPAAGRSASERSSG
jgi:hypothetical protein